MNKRVVLCVPIHNAELTLAETLDSLLWQDYPIWKIKLFNNASTDRTKEIISRYAEEYSNIEVFHSEVLVSGEENFTKCIQAAEGDYCTLVHSDDIYEKNFISKAVEAFTGNENCVAVFCHAREIDLHGNFIGERFVPPYLKKNELTYMSFKQLIELALNYANFLTCPSAVVRSEVYRDVVKTWEGGKFKSSADLDTWLRISKVGEVGFYSTALMRYRVATTSYSFRLAKVRTTRHDLFLVLEKYVRENMDWLSKDSLDDYIFLNYKDEAFRIINAWKNKVDFSQLGVLSNVNWFIVLKRMFRDKWHFRISAGIILSRTLLLFKRKP